MRESEFQRKITDLCDLLHLKWHHETDSRWSKPGFPDLLIAGPNGVVFAELKVGRGKVSEEQRKWLDALAHAGAEVHVWWPDEFEEINERLHDLAGRARVRFRQEV